MRNELQQPPFCHTICVKILKKTYVRKRLFSPVFLYMSACLFLKPSVLLYNIFKIILHVGLKEWFITATIVSYHLCKISLISKKTNTVKHPLCGPFWLQKKDDHLIGVKCYEKCHLVLFTKCPHNMDDLY